MLTNKPYSVVEHAIAAGVAPPGISELVSHIAPCVPKMLEVLNSLNAVVPAKHEIAPVTGNLI